MKFVEKTEPSNDVSWQGSCYKNAIKFVATYDDKDYYVCHGIVRGQGSINGVYICHGWVEDENFCYDHDAETNNVERIPKILYYSMGNIKTKDVKRYSKEEVIKNMTVYGNYGPWDDKLIKFAIEEEGSTYEI